MHHAGRHWRLAHGVADVEAFDPLGCLRQAERFAQRDHARFLGALLPRPLREREFRVLGRHLDPDATLALQRGLHLRAGEIELDLRPDQHQRRRRLLQVMLPEECGQHLARARLVRVLREEAPVADVPPAPDHCEVDARHAAIHLAGDDIGIHAPVGLDVLPRLYPRQRARLVPEHRGLLVVRGCGGGVHLVVQQADDVVLAALQKQLGALHVLGVALGADLPGAGRRAAADLVQQAGSRAVGEHRILAGAQAEHPLQQLDALPDRVRMGKRPEVAVGAIPGAAMEAQPRERMPGDHQVGIGLVVAEQDVVARRQALDVVVLQQQRLALGARHRGLDAGHLRQHHPDPRALVLFAEVGTDALAQVARLADVQRLALGAQHPVHAGEVRQAGNEGFRVKHGFGL